MRSGRLTLSVLLVGFAVGVLFAAPAYASFELVGTFGEGSKYNETGPKAEEGIGGAGGSIAVYDATGDVYVADYAKNRVDRFDAHGRFLEAWGWGVGDGKQQYERCGPDGEVNSKGEPLRCEGYYGNGLRGEGAGEFKSSSAIAVNQATGEVLVLSKHKIGDIQVFSATGELLRSFGEELVEDPTAPEQVIRQGGDMAVSTSGDLYVVDNNETPGVVRVMLFERESSGTYRYAHDVIHANLWHIERIAVDPQGDVYLKANDGPEGEGVYKFAANDFSAPAWGRSVPDGTGVAVDPTNGEVFYYNPSGNKIHGLDPTTGTELEAFPAINGHEAVEGLAFDPSLVWEAGRPAGVLYADTDFQSPEPALGEVFAQPPPFVPPRVDGESVGRVGSTSALLEGSVDPGGYETTYRFQYGSEDCATSSCVEVPVGGGDLGSGVKDLQASASVSGLLPATTYHYRVLASNQYGTVEGPDRTFTTYPSLAEGLPDGRVYEMVSPPLKDVGEVFAPEIVQGCNECTAGENITASTVQVAPDGGSIVYDGYPFAATGESVRYNEYRSTRAAGGWQTTDLSPVMQSPEGSFYPEFAPDLSVGILFQELGAALSGEAPAGYVDLYREDSRGGLSALVGAPPPDRSGRGSGSNGFKLSFGGASADFAHLVFMANDALTGASAFAPAAEDGGAEENNVYEWVGGSLRLVNVLPEGGTRAGATLGSGLELKGNVEAPDYSNAVSVDGSRIFWSEVATGQVYVRENGETTFKIPDPGRFLTASGDGSRVLLSDGRLYDLEDQTTTDLTEGLGGFQGILGASKDLSRVYFVDTAALPRSARNNEGQSAATGQDNLYEYDANTNSTWFIASLLPADDTIGPHDYADDWGASPSDRRAEATPDGGFLAFVSTAPLTGYANKGAREVFVYDAQSRSLACVSCSRTGISGGEGWLGLIRPESTAFPQPRDVLADGRVFFDSTSSLSPYDTNGVEDVYEYEPYGVGSCAVEVGCVFLISRGIGSRGSEFVGASASGADVFFTTRDRLVPADQDDLEDIYDARENGGFVEVTPPACTGTGCQGVPGAPPIFATPSSVTFAGVGNFDSTTSTTGTGKTKPKPKHRTVRCAKRRRLVHARCVKSEALGRARKAVHGGRLKGRR